MANLRLSKLRNLLGEHNLEIVSADPEINGNKVKAVEVVLPDQSTIVCLGVLRRFA